MSAVLRPDPSWHPLADGGAPRWASEWGEDRYGVFAGLCLEHAGERIRQRLRWIPPGTFWMGSPEDEPGRYDDEGPRHPVSIERGYWLFDTSCTQALWQAVMGGNPSRFQTPDRPVERVSWADVQTFLERINERISGLELALPSEAQWEHACRAGTETALYSGEIEILGANDAPALDAIAWYGGNSGQAFELEEYADSSGWPDKQYPHTRAGTHPVARRRPNPWGLYDMLGNVWEWTADRWHPAYEGAPDDGSVWEDGEAGADRVCRGGSWVADARGCRAAYRNWLPVSRYDSLGFRPARVSGS